MFKPDGLGTRIDWKSIGKNASGVYECIAKYRGKELYAAKKYQLDVQGSSEQRKYNFQNM